MQRLAREAGEVERDPVLRERLLDVRTQADRALRALPGEDAAPLPRHDQALVAEDAHRLLHGHPGHAVALGQLVERGQLGPRRERSGGDRGADRVGNLLARRAQPPMARPQLPLGTHGDIFYSIAASGSHVARTMFRGADGQTRQVQRAGRTQAQQPAGRLAGTDDGNRRLHFPLSAAAITPSKDDSDRTLPLPLAVETLHRR